MNKWVRIVSAGAVVGGLVLLQAVVGPSLAGKTSRCGKADLSLRLRLDKKRYDRDEPVHMRMRVKNVSGHACKVVFPSSQKSSFVVWKKGQKVWRDDHCKAFLQVITKERWEPGHQETYTGTWRQRNNRHKECGTGPAPRARARGYRAQGLFYGAYYKSGVLRTRRVWFRLTGKG
jgi:hypothetical protein